MLISFSTVGCPRWSWADIVSTAHDLGYQGIEVRGVGKDISVPSVPAFGADQIDATKANLAALGLSISCLASDCCLHLAETAERTQAEMRAYIDLAQSLGAPYVRVMATDAVPQPTGTVDEGVIIAQAQAIAPYAAEKGVTLLIETNGVWADSARLAGLLTRIAHPAFAALWDVHHPYRYMGERPADTYQRLAPFIRHVHLKDSVSEGGQIQYRMLGNGDLPLTEAITVLENGSYTGFYCLEWVKRWNVSLEEPGIVFAHYVNYMQSL